MITDVKNSSSVIDMVCPSCGSSEIRVSRHPHAMDMLERLRGRQPYRCRKCRGRFYSSNPLPPDVSNGSLSSQTSRRSSTRKSPRKTNPRNRRHLLKTLTAVVIFAAMFVIFWWFLRYLTTERDPSPDATSLRSILPTAQLPTTKREPRHCDDFDQPPYRPCTVCLALPSCVAQDVLSLNLSRRSDVRVIYRIPSNAKIQPETAGRGNG